MGTMTTEQVEAGLRNIGYDVDCGACMAVFYTGYTLPGEEHTCKPEKTPVELTVVPFGGEEKEKHGSQ